METQIFEVLALGWCLGAANKSWIGALEAGKVLFFPRLEFSLKAQEMLFLTPAIRDPKARNISLGADGMLKGATGDAATQSDLAAMMARFRAQSRSLIESLFPRYAEALGVGATSYRPADVATRVQSWRADDRRLHVDAFPSRPNYGERLLRVFANINPHGVPRIWRVGEPFEAVARHFLPLAKPYSPWRAKALHFLHVTKSLRSEYDHLMLQLHDRMKADTDYQRNARQAKMPFPPGSAWVCFSDQTSHAAMSGQYMIEQTFRVPVASQYQPESSPLAILSRMTGRTLV